MSRKDYNAIAAIVAKHCFDLNDAGIALVAELTDYLEADNVNFDRERFIDACIPTSTQAVRYARKPTTYVGLALEQQSRKS